MGTLSASGRRALARAAGVCLRVQQLLAPGPPPRAPGLLVSYFGQNLTVTRRGVRRDWQAQAARSGSPGQPTPGPACC